jgi:hypothetical protein
MLDFSQGLAGLIQKSVAAPAVALVVFSKSVGADAAEAILKDAEFEHGEMVTKGDSLLFPAEDFDLAAHFEDEDETPMTFFKIDDLVGFGVTGDTAQTIQKGFQGYDYTSKSFKDVMATNTAMPMVRIAMSALSDTFYNIMHDADTPDQAAEEMSKAVADFDGQVIGVVKSIPAAAFKLEAAVQKAATAEAEAGAEEDGTEEEGDEEDAEVQKGGGKGKDEDGQSKKKPTKKAAEDADESEEETEEEEEESDEGETVSKSADSDKLDAILKTVTGFDKRLAKVEKQSADTASSVKKMDEELGSGVIGSEPAGDNVKKGDEVEDGDAGFISLDTGYGTDPFDDEDDKQAA